MEYSKLKHQMLVDFANEAMSKWDDILNKDSYLKDGKFNTDMVAHQIENNVTNVLKSVATLVALLGEYAAIEWNGTEFTLA